VTDYDNYLTLNCKIKYSYTDKVLIEVLDPYNPKTVWVPRSQLHPSYRDVTTTDSTIRLTSWYAFQLGLDG
jgi:hypothetical protein